MKDTVGPIDALVARLPLADEETRNRIMDGMFAELQESTRKQAPIEVRAVETSRLEDGSSVVTGLVLDLKDDTGWSALIGICSGDPLPEPATGVARNRDVLIEPPTVSAPGIFGVRVQLRFRWYER